MYVDSVQQILEVLKAVFKGGPFKEFYDGDPDVIPAFNLPALSVSKLGDDTTPGTTAQDDVAEQIVIKVILNKKDDWDNAVDPLDLTEHKIRSVMDQRDPVTGRYLTTTVKGALRDGFTDGNLAIDQQMRLDLGVLPRPNDVITAEGHLTITVKYAVNID